MKISKLISVVIGIFAVLVYSGCLITEVNQTATVQAGGNFTANLTISEMTAETNPHKGILCVLVPSDWTFTSGTFTSSVGSGTLAVNTDLNPVYGDIDTIIVPPAGMKWVDLISSAGFAHPANLVMDATVNFKVGTAAGTYMIGYAATKNTLDMMKSFNMEEIDNTSAWTDTSMNHRVVVTAASSIDEKISGIPADYKLTQNYPNPFNPSTSFNYSLKNSGDVQISLFDITGKEVKQLVSGFRSAGNYVVNFNASDLSSGIYYYRIVTNDFVQTNKMILLK